MSKLVSSVADVTENIKRYNENLDAYRDLLPFARAWYALKTSKGWLFGPSKIIGYADMSPEEYLGRPYSAAKHGRVSERDKHANPLDGRVTEGVLSRWSELIEKGHPLYNELHTALNELCGRYGKKPNGLCRISIIKSATDTSVPDFDDSLVELLAAVFKQLTPAQQTSFRKKTA
ncbi:hypothetical protein [Bosea sp. (in: a-proteobacteria)]|jgi:hypothetical protein|uniref:hypothetical protein n=1 Tax=Bosea sp. (in: a-proteobacteria) TaxID=1871050 RepID=UPI003564B15F